MGEARKSIFFVQAQQRFLISTQCTQAPTLTASPFLLVYFTKLNWSGCAVVAVTKLEFDLHEIRTLTSRAPASIKYETIFFSFMLLHSSNQIYQPSSWMVLDGGGYVDVECGKLCKSHS